MKSKSKQKTKLLDLPCCGFSFIQNRESLPDTRMADVCWDQFD